MLSLLESFRQSDSKDASNNEISKSVVTVTSSSVAHSAIGVEPAIIEPVVALGDNVLDVIGETA
jgi:hypothetical protein